MSVRRWLAVVTAGGALVACGGPGVTDSTDNARSEAMAAPGEPVEVTPVIRLQGLDSGVGSVVVEELLMHVQELRLTPLDDAGSDSVAPPLWVRYTRQDGAELGAVEPVVVPAADYSVSVTVAPSSHARRTPGELNGASVVVRGVCQLFQPQEMAAPDSRRGFDSGHGGNWNPVPMPALPQAKPTGGELVRVPFSFAIETSVSVDLPERVSLRQYGADLSVTLDVGRWMEQSVHPIVAAAAGQPGRLDGGTVNLRFAEDETDPAAESFRRALEESMAGSLSAELGE